MKRYVALCAALVAACGAPPHLDDVAVSGPVDRPVEDTTVRVAALDGGPVAFPTTAPPTTTTHTHPTTTTTAPVVPATVAPPVTYAPSSGSCGGWEGLVAQFFPNEVGTACRIIMCESRGNPNAVSSTADHGLAQVNEPTWNKPGHHDPVADWIGRNWHNVYDPATNLEMARRIRSAYGWQMWSCAR